MGTIHGEKFDVSKEWSIKDSVPLIDREPKIKPSMFKKFFIGSIIFFVVAAGFAMIKIFGGSNTVSNDNIEISILGNSFTPGGEELPLQVVFVATDAARLHDVSRTCREADVTNVFNVNFVEDCYPDELLQLVYSYKHRWFSLVLFLLINCGHPVTTSS
jgi:hypothetical protein